MDNQVAYNFIVDNASKGIRLDVFLSSAITKTRSFVKGIIDSGDVLVDGVSPKAGHILKEGQSISVVINAKNIAVEPKDIELDIIYEDDYLIVINKRQGMVVHPANGHYDDTVVNAMLFKLGRSTINIDNTITRPYIVHRLDKDTSGIMIIAKNDDIQLALSKQFADRTVKKVYLGVVSGIVSKDSDTISAPIGRSVLDRKKMSVVQSGRIAITKYTTIQRFAKSTYLRLEILTGRTHQIRVHTKHIGHPIVGDSIYGNTTQCDNQLLHSYSLEIEHPITKQIMLFEAPVPHYFVQYLKSNGCTCIGDYKLDSE